MEGTPSSSQLARWARGTSRSDPSAPLPERGTSAASRGPTSGACLVKLRGAPFFVRKRRIQEVVGPQCPSKDKKNSTPLHCPHPPPEKKEREEDVDVPCTLGARNPSGSVSGMPRRCSEPTPACFCILPLRVPTTRNRKFVPGATRAASDCGCSIRQVSKWIANWGISPK